MESHVKALGILYIVGAILTAGLGLALFGVIAGSGLISGEREAILATGIIGTILGAVLLAISIPGLIAGIGLLKRRPWARVLALILGVLHLFGFPVGTALGIYTLYVLTNDQTKPLFV